MKQEKGDGAMRKGDAVRFKPESWFGRDSGIPLDQVGLVLGCYRQDGERRANVDFRPAGYVFGVEAEQLEVVEPAVP